MVIHTIGDSHSKYGWLEHLGDRWEDLDYINRHHLGPVLCYSFGKKNLDICDINKFNIKNDDSVVFCFGEIDCRCHVHKYINSVKSYKMIINEIIHNYINAIKINLENCNVKLKNICVFNIPPTPQKKQVKSKVNFPLLGTDEERKSYATYFNKCLKDKCNENKWIFFDVYDSYCDNNGFLNKKYSDGDDHILNSCFIKKFINDNHLL